MLSEPNSPPEEPSDLGMAISDLPYKSLEEVVHPGRKEQTDEESVDSSEEKHHENIS